MIRRRVACTCSRESDPITDEQRRALGWRLVPATTGGHVGRGEVFVWCCPECVALRNAQLTQAKAV